MNCETVDMTGNFLSCHSSNKHFFMELKLGLLYCLSSSRRWGSSHRTPVSFGISLSKVFDSERRLAVAAQVFLLPNSTQ